MDMCTPSPQPSTLVVFEGARLTDDALARLVRTGMRVVSVGPREDHDYLAYRWRAVGGAPDLVYGGCAAHLGEAVEAAASHESVLVAAPVPRHPIKTLHTVFAALGRMAGSPLPAVAVQFMRPHAAPGPAAVIADGEVAHGFAGHLAEAVAALPGQPVDRLVDVRRSGRHARASATPFVAADPVAHVAKGGYALAVQCIHDGRGTEGFLWPRHLETGRDSLADLASVLRLLRDARSADVVAVVESSSSDTVADASSRVAVLPV